MFSRGRTSRRLVSVVIVLATVYLVASATPVAALQTADTFGSVHHYADFEDDFDSEAADSGIPDDWETTDSTSTTVNVSTQQALTGSQSVYLESGSSSDFDIRPAEQPHPHAVTNNVSVSIFQTDGGESNVWLFEGGTTLTTVGLQNGNLVYWDGGNYNQISGGDFNQNEWVNVTIYDIDPSSDTFSVAADNGSHSTTATGIPMAFEVSEGYDITQLHQDPGGQGAYFDAFDIEGAEGEFIAEPHNIEHSTKGFTNLTIPSGSVDVQWEEYPKGKYELDLERDDSDWVDLGSGSSLKDHTSAFSVAGWFKLESKPSGAGNHMVLMGKGSLGEDFTIYKFEGTGDLRFLINDGSTNHVIAIQNADIQTGTWYHFTATWDGSSDMTIYLDGSPKDSESGVASMEDEKDVVGIGADGGGARPLDGELDDVRFYDRELSSAEASDLASGADVTNGLVSEWEFDEGSGSTATDSAGSNDGTVNGAVYVQDRLWSVLGSNTFSSTGNHTITWTKSQNASVRVNVTFANDQQELHDEGVIYESVEPEVDNSTASPTGDLSQSDQTLSIQINDTDFPLVQGDSVDVEFFVDSSAIGTDTIASNGTATLSHTFTGGDHTWHAVATDSSSLSNTSDTFSVSAPKNLSIRPESAPDEYVDEVEVNVTAYARDGTIVTKTTNDGNVSLDGFPIDQAIIVRANASGYYPRSTVIEDIYDQQSMYMLNRSTPAYLVRSDLQDPTGNFPRGDTVLFVDRDLNKSGTVEWTTIAGDEFGVSGVPVYLEQEERFRLRVKNLETGDVNVIGPFTAIQSETVTVSTGSATVEFPESNRSYNWQVTENETGKYVLFEYNDTAEQTEEVKLTVHERYNDSNVLVDNQTFTGTNNIVHQQLLSNEQVNTTWMAELYIDRGDGFEHYRVPVTGGQRSIIPVDLDATWVTGVGVFIVLITGMAFSQLNQGVGAITTSLVGGMLWYLGVLDGVTIGPAIVAAIAISFVFHYQQSGGVAS